jgi:hypothetical protein
VSDESPVLSDQGTARVIQGPDGAWYVSHVFHQRFAAELRAENEALKDALREARAFLDTRHGSDGKLRRPANLIDTIDGLCGASDENGETK